MKGLATLIRLHKLKLTDQQRKLAALQAVANGFRTEIETLDARTRAEAEAVADSPETGHLLGGFVQATLTRRRVLEGSLADIDRDMEAVRRDINAAFRELKKYETIEERRAADAKKTQAKHDRRAEDELGMSMHRQARQAAGG